MSPLEADLQANLNDIRSRIAQACQAAGRDLREVELLPVSKFQSLEAIRAAKALGLTRFGENYVQEGTAKALAFPDLEFVIHGPLQRNKAKPALQHFHEIMCVDRLDLALRLARLAQEMELTRPTWIQVDLWGEATKMGGCPLPELPALIETLSAGSHLPLQGFMAIPPPGSSRAFTQLAYLRGDWQQRLGKKLRLSMGMSDDLEAAIAAGTDQLRIGSALFGARSTAQ